MKNSKDEIVFMKIMDKVGSMSSIRKFFFIVEIIVCFILSIIIGSSILRAQSGFYLQFVCVLLLSVILVITGIVERVKKLYITTLVFGAVYALMWMGVLFDEPYFIRKIQGENFISIWLVFATCVLIIAFVTELILVISRARAGVPQAKDKLFSDSDLMLMQEFDRFQLAGYYLLKAKLHNIIKYEFKKSDEASEAMPAIELNEEFPKPHRDMYCKENPQVGKIVSYIENTKEYEPDTQIRIADLIYGINPQPEIQSEGGKFADAYIKKLKKSANIIFAISTCIGFYPAITKLLMGMYNEKLIDNLFFCLFFSVIVAVCTYFANKAFVNFLITRNFKNSIIDLKSADFKNIEALFENTDFNYDVPPKERGRLLRAYALHKGRFLGNKYSADNVHYSSAIFSAIFSAQVAQSLNKKSSDSGCSSCGGCGGGCGGCGGGCGGCGD